MSVTLISSRNRTFYKIILWLLLLGQMSACSSTTQAYKETLELAFVTPPDHLLSRQELASRPFDNLYVRFDNRQQAILTLGFVEAPQVTPQFVGIVLPPIYKWVSSDRGLVFTQGHRVVKTLGLPTDMWQSPVVNNDPLLQPLNKIRIGQAFQSKSDWSNQRANVVNRHVIKAKNIAELEISKVKHAVVYIAEEVLFPDGNTAVNEFWFSQQTGVILKTRQTLAPFFPVVELIFVSQAYREETLTKSSVTGALSLNTSERLSSPHHFNLNTMLPGVRIFENLVKEHDHAQF
jgi:hypothetical protein